MKMNWTVRITLLPVSGKDPYKEVKKGLGLEEAYILAAGYIIKLAKKGYQHTPVMVGGEPLIEDYRHSIHMLSPEGVIAQVRVKRSKKI